MSKSAGGSPAQFDVVLDLCRDSHRRIVLAVLADQRRTVTMQDLTKAVVKHDHQTPLTEVSGEVVTRIQIPLHHVHLPKIAASGFVEYDLERQLVEPTDQFDRLGPSLSAIIDADPDLESPVEL